MIVKKRSITFAGLLKYLDAEVTAFFPMTKKGAWLRGHGLFLPPWWEDYFPSVILRAANKLERKGLVEKISTKDGVVINITDKGRKEILKINLSQLQPKTGKWDGKWRMVFFDVPRNRNHKRDALRDYLKLLGMKQMQESVWVSPYDISGEVKYIREILDIADMVKLAELSYLENAEDLRQIFEV